MDGTLVFDNNLQALKRILAGLIGMAGLAGRPYLHTTSAHILLSQP